MKIITFFLITAVSILLFGCGSHKTENVEEVTHSGSSNSVAPIKDTASLKVYVDLKGLITADSKLITLKELEVKM